MDMFYVSDVASNFAGNCTIPTLAIISTAKNDSVSKWFTWRPIR